MLGGIALAWTCYLVMAWRFIFQGSSGSLVQHFSIPEHMLVALCGHFDFTRVTSTFVERGHVFF